MTDDLRYPSLRSILEYMEANKRIYLDSRCPQLFQIEKPIPIRIHHLKFQEKCVQLNDITFTLTKSSHEYEANQKQLADQFELTPGDIIIEASSLLNFVNIKFESKFGFKNLRRLPAHVEMPVAVKTLTTFLLGGRKVVKVQNLDFDFKVDEVLRLPEGIKFWTKNLNTFKRDFETFLPLLDEKSYPLERLTVRFLTRENINISVLHCAKDLVVKMIWDDYDVDVVVGNQENVNDVEEEEENIEIEDIEDVPEDWWMEPRWNVYLKQLPNDSVQFQGHRIDNEAIIDLIRYWKENGKELGTCFSFDNYITGDLVKKLRLIKTQVEGAYRYFDGEDGHLSIPYYLSVPISDSSELNIYGVKDPEKSGSSLLQLKVEPALETSANRDGLRAKDQLYMLWSIVKFEPDLETVFLVLLMLSGIIIFFMNWEKIHSELWEKIHSEFYKHHKF